MKDDHLVLTENVSGKKCTITAKGFIDSNSADILHYRLEDILKNGQTTIVMDMSQIEYLSSIGIRVILQIYKQAAEAGGKFNIIRPSQIVKNVLGMVALKQMLITD